jgi:carboxyl-terminal processing protease
MYKSASEKLTARIFIYQLDPYKLFFTKPECDSIYQNFNHWATETSMDSLNHFLDFSKALYGSKIMRAKNIVASLDLKDLQIEQVDTFLLENPFSDRFAANLGDLTNRWRILEKIRLLSLWNIEDTMNRSELLSDVRDKELCWLDDQLNELEENEFIFNQYLKAIAMAYDPHSEFMTLEEVSIFNHMLSKSSLNFGFEAEKTRNGNMRIVRIVPGGAAWKSGTIKGGEEVWQIVDEAGVEHNISCWSMEKINQLLDDPANKSVSFLIKHEEGGTSYITLQKEETENIKNLINIYQLEGKYNIGYFALPSFYDNDASMNLFGSTNDVTKAIMKVKDEKLDGLIMDLRDNGGGSLAEAVGLASIFLHTGPICIMKARNGDPVLLKDLNRGAVYSGPLMILVNENSASASEVLAAALQDHNRALIVGTPTFGKASSQRIILVDSLSLEFGFLKITMENIYRFPGNSYQNEGVIPDVVLAGDYSYFTFREADYPNPLTRNSVNKKVYFEQLKSFPINHLQQKYNDRRDSTAAEDVSEKNMLIYPASIKKMRKDFLEKPNYAAGKFSVINNKYDLGIIDALETERIMDRNEKQTIEADRELAETYLIMCDLIDKLNE